jgi:hypothetical protein
MAMKIFRTILVSLVVLILGSCDALQVIFGSVYPATLALAKEQADLSHKIDSGSGESFQLRVIETGSYGYVVLEGGESEGKKTFFFYDLDLGFKKSFTFPVANGNGVMIDSGGKINAGGTLLNPATLKTTGASGTVLYNNGGAGNDGFLASSSEVTGFNFQSGSSILNYSIGGSQLSSPALSTSLSNLQVDAVFDNDPSDSTSSVVIVVSQSGGNDNSDDAARYFLTFSKNDFIGSLSTAQGLLDTAPSRSKLLRESLGFADGSIMAYEGGAARYVRIDPADASIRGSLYSTKSKNARFAYRIGGGEFYGFDTDSRILTKYVAWW